MAYNLQHTQPQTAAGVNEIGPKFGIKTVYCWRASDPYPDHPAGLAADFMISDIPNGHAVGDQLANYVIANAKRLGVKYLIWNRRSWNTERGTWVGYTGSNPHTDHVHVTWYSTPPAGGGAVIEPVGNPATQASEALKQLDQIAQYFTTAGNWRRIALWGGGSLLVVIGLFTFDRVAAVAARGIGTVSGKIAGKVKYGVPK